MSLLDMDLRELLYKLEVVVGVKMPRKVISASLENGVLHIRFSYPKGGEADVEPLPLKTPVYLFRDEESREITAIEVVDADKLLRELGMLR